MKKATFLFLSGLLFAVMSVAAQSTKTQSLDTFTKIDLEGNIEIHLIKSDKPSVEIETKNDDDFEDFTIKVKNDELFLGYRKNRGNTPKFKVYLMHTGLEEVSMSGLVSLFSQDVLSEPDLMLKGSGIVKGEIEIDVDNFQIDSDGITNLSISGTADNAEFNIEGLGKINAKRLSAKSIKQHTDGFAKVKVGS